MPNSVQDDQPDNRHDDKVHDAADYTDVAQFPGFFRSQAGTDNIPLFISPVHLMQTYKNEIWLNTIRSRKDYY